MIKREEVSEKIEAFKKHFGFKDFLGFSSLIFGLLLSNTSYKNQTLNQPPSSETQKQSVVKPAKKTAKTKKKGALKLRPLKKQKIAARKSK